MLLTSDSTAAVRGASVCTRADAAALWGRWEGSFHLAVRMRLLVTAEGGKRAKVRQECPRRKESVTEGFYEAHRETNSFAQLSCWIEALIRLTQN